MPDTFKVQEHTKALRTFSSSQAAATTNRCTSLQLNRSFSHTYKFLVFVKSKFRAQDTNEKKGTLAKPSSYFPAFGALRAKPGPFPSLPTLISPCGVQASSDTTRFLRQHQNGSVSSGLINAGRSWLCLQVGNKQQYISKGS